MQGNMSDKKLELKLKYSKGRIKNLETKVKEQAEDIGHLTTELFKLRVENEFFREVIDCYECNDTNAKDLSAVVASCEGFRSNYIEYLKECYKERFGSGLEREMTIEGFETACEQFDIDFPLDVVLPSGKRELVNNNFEPCGCDCCDCEYLDEEDLSDLEDYDDYDDEECYNCIDKYTCEESPYYVGEYDPYHINKIQDVIDKVDYIVDELMVMKKEYKVEEEWEIVGDLEILFDMVIDLFPYLRELQEELNKEEMYDYLKRRKYLLDK